VNFIFIGYPLQSIKRCFCCSVYVFKGMAVSDRDHYLDKWGVQFARPPMTPVMGE
jgi:hypothetical protein